MLDYLLTVLTAGSLIFSLYSGSTEELSQAVLKGSENAVKLCLALAGSMALWGGIMNVADKCGLNRKIARLISKPLRVLFKDMKNRKELELISLNTAANLLGLGNAATPLGLKAMSGMMKNKCSQRELAYFILLNTASIQLIPVTIAAMRSAHGSSSPWETALPTIITSACALTAGLVTTAVIYPESE